jgi:hypothetical protein
MPAVGPQNPVLREILDVSAVERRLRRVRETGAMAVVLIVAAVVVILGATWWALRDVGD